MNICFHFIVILQKGEALVALYSKISEFKYSFNMNSIAADKQFDPFFNSKDEVDIIVKLDLLLAKTGQIVFDIHAGNPQKGLNLLRLFEEERIRIDRLAKAGNFTFESDSENFRAQRYARLRSIWLFTKSCGLYLVDSLER